MPHCQHDGFEKPRFGTEAGDFGAVVGNVSSAAGAGPGVDFGAGEGGAAAGEDVEGDVDEVD